MMNLQGIKDILQRFPQDEWRDTLSLLLFRWGKKVQTARREDYQLIEELVSTILVDPLNRNTPLRKAVLERKFVWEEETLVAYRKRASFSIWDGQEMEPDRPHDLANSVIVWVRTFLQSTPQTLALIPARSQGVVKSLICRTGNVSSQGTTSQALISQSPSSSVVVALTHPETSSQAIVLLTQIAKQHMQTTTLVLMADGLNDFSETAAQVGGDVQERNKGHVTPDLEKSLPAPSLGPLQQLREGQERLQSVGANRIAELERVLKEGREREAKIIKEQNKYR